MTYAQFAFWAGIAAIFVAGLIIGSMFGYSNGVRDTRERMRQEAQHSAPTGTIVGLRKAAAERAE